MIPVKITYLDTAETKLIPVTWGDITWAKFVEYEGKEFSNEIERLSFISGVPVEHLQNNLLFLSSLVEMCQFMYDDLNAYMGYVPAKYLEINIGKDEWGKLESAKAAIMANPKNKWSGGAEVVKFYTGDDINDKPCTEVIGSVAFFLSKSQSSLSDIKY